MVPGRGVKVGAGVGEVDSGLSVGKRGVDVNAGMMVKTEAGESGEVLNRMGSIQNKYINELKRIKPAKNILDRITRKLNKRLTFMLI